MQRAVSPTTVVVVGVIPTVVGPVADTDDEIMVAVAVVIDVPPHVGANAVAVNVAPRIDLPRLIKVEITALLITREFVARFEDPRFTVDVADLEIVCCFSDSDSRLKDGHFDFGILRRILEEVDAVGRLVGAGNQQVHVAVAIVVHRHRPSPQPNAQVNDQVGMVVRQRLEFPVRFVCHRMGRGQTQHSHQEAVFHRCIQRRGMQTERRCRSHHGSMRSQV